MNQYSNNAKIIKTIHAEKKAILGLKNRNTKKLKKVNLLVIKTSKTHKLGNSKPCYHCLMDMKNLCPQKGYKINNIYYSDENGIIIEKKLSNMIREGNYHYSSYYKNVKKCNQI